MSLANKKCSLETEVDIVKSIVFQQVYLLRTI